MTIAAGAIVGGIAGSFAGEEAVELVCPEKEQKICIGMTTSFIHDDVVTAHFKDGTNWSVPLSNIALIGEHTTQEGPGADDHFICIVDYEGNRYDISDEDGAMYLLEELARVIGDSLTPHLQYSTEFQSCILYPKSIKGQTLFIRPCLPRTLFERIKWLFSSGVHQLQFTNDANTIIEKSQNLLGK